MYQVIATILIVLLVIGTFGLFAQVENPKKETTWLSAILSSIVNGAIIVLLWKAYLL